MVFRLFVLLFHLVDLLLSVMEAASRLVKRSHMLTNLFSLFLLIRFLPYLYIVAKYM